MHYLVGTMDYGIHYSGYPRVQIRSLTWMSCMPRVDIFSLLVVVLFHEGHANRQS
jgi:hypothetical protein